VQNVVLHWRGVLSLGFLRSTVTVALWDALVASLAYLVLLPLLAVLVDPLFLLGYLIDIPAVLVPVLWMARRRGEVGRALASVPGFIVLRFVNSWFILRALFRELILRRPLLVYEKGH
jgi:hypothetical protein